MENAEKIENIQYAIKVEDLHIRYKTLKAYSIKKNLLRLKKSEVDEFEAVRGVTFQVPKGEIMGIIGKNGSGKSTMLRAIAGIFSADEGSIDLCGNKVSLLSIGVGFKKQLSGRENILLSGLLLGYTETQVREHMQEIIDFAEIGQFIDMPVRTYSSGMYSKLAFSITAILESDIMLIDEVLSVGDAKFKKKSFNKMKKLISNHDRTVMIVSHDIQTLSDLCETVMWMHDGKIKKIGPADEVLEEYKEFMK
ncbi:MAG: ABC transporter ATP-binding protein [Lachnospiraceae bacterium]|nr:ABC transporter ATP-binding protein [Lachnospiraceae bacterium]